MKNFLNSFFLSAFFCILGKVETYAQPIQLIPQGKQAPSHTPIPSTQTPTNFWEGTPPPILETYLPKIPIRLTSPLLRKIREEILKEKYAPLVDTPAYETTRLTLLIKIGRLEDAQKLLSTSSLPEKDIFLINILWLEGDKKRACEKVSNLMRVSSLPLWKEQNIYCLSLSGEDRRGRIAAELFSETNPEVSQLVSSLFNPHISLSFSDKIGESPFHFTVWCALGKKIPEENLATLPPAFLPLIVRSETMPLETRISAGEKALQQGTLKAEALLDLLKNPSNKPHFLKEFSLALEKKQTDSLLSLLQEAKRTHKLGLLVELFSSQISILTPSEETLPIAPYLVRGALEKGNNALAKKWANLYLREAPDEAISILPLLHLARFQTKWTEVQMLAWQAYQSRSHPKIAHENSYTLRRCLEALGKQAGSAMKGEQKQPSWRQAQLLWKDQPLDLLESAVKSERKGEALLLFLIFMGSTPLQDIPPDKFFYFLKVLTALKCKNEARSLALAYLLAKGF